MAYSIETQKHSVYQIPAWVPMHLGRHVRLIYQVDEYEDGSFIHKAGSVGILDAIQWSYQTGDVYLVVAFGCDLSSLTNVPLGHVQPV